MKRLFAAAFILASWTFVAGQQQQVAPAARPNVSSPTYPERAPVAQPSTYFPPRFDWQHKKPEDVGMDSSLIAEAVKVSIDRQNPGPKDMTLFLKGSFGREPFDTLIGPVKDRGGAAGVITRRGYIVAEWGDPNRADITNSVTKT